MCLQAPHRQDIVGTSCLRGTRVSPGLSGLNPGTCTLLGGFGESITWLGGFGRVKSQHMCVQLWNAEECLLLPFESSKSSVVCEFGVALL